MTMVRDQYARIPSVDTRQSLFRNFGITALDVQIPLLQPLGSRL